MNRTQSTGGRLSSSSRHSNGDKSSKRWLGDRRNVPARPHPFLASKTSKVPPLTLPSTRTERKGSSITSAAGPQRLAHGRTKSEGGALAPKRDRVLRKTPKLTSSVPSSATETRPPWRQANKGRRSAPDTLSTNKPSDRRKIRRDAVARTSSGGSVVTETENSENCDHNNDNAMQLLSPVPDVQEVSPKSVSRSPVNRSPWDRSPMNRSPSSPEIFEEELCVNLLTAFQLASCLFETAPAKCKISAKPKPITVDLAPWQISLKTDDGLQRLSKLSDSDSTRGSINAEDLALGNAAEGFVENVGKVQCPSYSEADSPVSNRSESPDADTSYDNDDECFSPGYNDSPLTGDELANHINESGRRYSVEDAGIVARSRRIEKEELALNF